MSTKVRMPNLANATPGFIVDELGAVRKKLSKLKKLEGFYKEALRARLKKNQRVVEGEKFSATITKSARTSLNTDAVKEEMGAGWWKDRCVTKTIETIRTDELENLDEDED